MLNCVRRTGQDRLRRCECCRMKCFVTCKTKSNTFYLIHFMKPADSKSPRNEGYVVELGVLATAFDCTTSCEHCMQCMVHLSSTSVQQATMPLQQLSTRACTARSSTTQKQHVRPAEVHPRHGYKGAGRRGCTGGAPWMLGCGEVGTTDAGLMCRIADVVVRTDFK